MKALLLCTIIVGAGCGFSISHSEDGGVPIVIDGDGATDANDASIDAMTDAMTDAMPDAMPMWVDVETISVDCVGGIAGSTTMLQANVMYRLRGEGTCVANTSGPSHADAEYVDYDTTGPTSVYNSVDTGIAINDLIVDATRFPSWGNYSGTHVYYAMVTGAGTTISAQYHESNWANNDGALSLTIQAFQ